LRARAGSGQRRCRDTQVTHELFGSFGSFSEGVFGRCPVRVGAEGECPLPSRSSVYRALVRHVLIEVAKASAAAGGRRPASISASDGGGHNVHRGCLVLRGRRRSHRCSHR